MIVVALLMARPSSSIHGAINYKTNRKTSEARLNHWLLRIHKSPTMPSPTNPLSSIPQAVIMSSQLDTARICPGNPDSGFIHRAERKTQRKIFDIRW